MPVTRRFQSASNIDKLRAAAKAQSTGFKRDERYWRLTTDTSGSGRAVIRFLPANPKKKKSEPDPWVKYWRHSFKGPGGWYIENCPTSLGRDHKCPVCELNRDLFAADDKATVTLQKRKPTHVSNVVVVKDPAVPANEGKVFLFSYGVKIFGKLEEKFAPKEADDVAVDPFHLYEGMNFKLRQKQVAKFPNYDDSVFDGASALGTDDEIEAIVGQMHDLQPIIAPDQFKSYEELKKRLDGVLKTSNTDALHQPQSGISDPAEEETDLDTAPPPVRPTKAAKPSAKVAPAPSPAPTIDADDTAAFFANLQDEESDV